MLSPRLTNCPECANIPSLLKKIDCKLAELGNNLYNNISYMLNKPIEAGNIIQLIAYRRILSYKYCNPNYVHEYSVQMIASRVIRLTAGCVSKCNELERCLEEPCDIKIVPNPTTTSTSTLPITTTTSTSSTSSTTTTSTTVVPITTTTTSSSSSTTTTTTSSSSTTTTTTTVEPTTTTTTTLCAPSHPYQNNLIKKITTSPTDFTGSLPEACEAAACLNSATCLVGGILLPYWDSLTPPVGAVAYGGSTGCGPLDTTGYYVIDISGTYTVVEMLNGVIQSYPTC